MYLANLNTEETTVRELKKEGPKGCFRLDCGYSVCNADVTSNEMPLLAIMNVDSQDVEANYINSTLVVYLDVDELA